MKIVRCRVSAVWVEAFPDLLQTPNTARLGSLIDNAGYAGLFNGLLAADTDPLVRLPWSALPGAKYPARNNYWNDAIVQWLRDHARADAGAQAFRSVIPLRHRPNLVKLDTAERSFVEGWYFPGGIGLTATIWLAGSFDPQQLQAAVNATLNDPLAVAWSDGRQQQLRLNSVAERCLDVLRSAGFGAIAAGFRPNPSRVLTIIRAEHDGDPAQRAADQQAMLEAVLGAAGGAPNLTPQRDIYAWSRGAVIWRPDRFLAATPNIHTLGCLHRNVVLAFLNVAGLLRAAAVLAAELAQPGDPVPPRLDPYARAVAGTLARVHGGVDAYALPCVQQLIAAPQQKSVVDQLRDRLGLPPLR